MADGQLMNRGKPIDDIADFLRQTQNETGTARLMPDQNTQAVRMIEVARLLRQNGAERVVILSEKLAQ
jgi:biopolymer transport protein ExbD